MDDKELLYKLIDKVIKQDNFILKMFQDDRIDKNIKEEYSGLYNELKVSIV